MPLAEQGVRVVRQRRLWTWTLFSAVLITVGALLAPVAILADWTQRELSSTDDFVATFAPLADDRQVQDYLAAKTSSVILEKADIDGLTARLVEGVQSIGLPPKADAALGALGGLAAQSAKDAVSATVTKFVRSPKFAGVFEKTLRITHTQLVATLRGGSNAVVSLAHGTVGIQLGPIVAAVKKSMLKQGLTVANAIPAVDKTVVLIRSAQLATAQKLYAVVVAIGTWMPWFVIIVLVGGVLLAKRRRTALIVAGTAVGFVAILTVIAIDLGKIVTVSQLAALLIPAGVADVVFGQITDFTRNSAVVVAFVAILLALATWLTRTTGVPARLRAAGSSITDTARSAAERSGLTTGSFGVWLHLWRRVIRWLIAAVAALLVLIVRPLSTETIVSITVVSVLALVLLELLQRPTPATPPATTTESTA